MRIIDLPEFRLFWAAQSASVLGTAVSRAALPLLAAATLSATPFQLGLLQASLTVSFLVLGLPAGTWIDRMRRRPVMIACDIARGLLMAGLALAAVLGTLDITLLIVVGLLLGVGRTFYEIAYQSYIPLLVGRDRLVEGNAKLEGTASASQTAGPAAAGALVQLGSAAAVSIQAVSYLFSGLLLLRIRKPEVVPRQPPQAGGMGEQIMSGLRFVLGNPLVRAVTGAAATYNFFYAMLTPLIVLLLIQEVGLTESGAGALMTVSGFGGLLGAATAQRVARWVGQVRVIWVAYLVTIPTVVLIPLTGSGWRLGFFLVPWFVSAYGLVVYNVAAVSFRQAMCPDHLLGRMNASVRFLIWGIIPLGALVGGALGSWLGVRGALAVAGSGMASGVLWIVGSRLRRMRDMPRVEGESMPADRA